MPLLCTDVLFGCTNKSHAASRRLSYSRSCSYDVGVHLFIFILKINSCSDQGCTSENIVYSGTKSYFDQFGLTALGGDLVKSSFVFPEKKKKKKNISNTRVVRTTKLKMRHVASAARIFAAIPLQCGSTVRFRSHVSARPVRTGVYTRTAGI